MDFFQRFFFGGDFICEERTLKCNFVEKDSDVHRCAKPPRGEQPSGVSISSSGIPALFMALPSCVFPWQSPPVHAGPLCPSQPPLGCRRCRVAKFFSLRLTRQRGISADGLLILSGSVHRARRSGRRGAGGAGRETETRWTLCSTT